MGKLELQYNRARQGSIHQELTGDHCMQMRSINPFWQGLVLSGSDRAQGVHLRKNYGRGSKMAEQNTGKITQIIGAVTDTKVLPGQDSGNQRRQSRVPLGRRRQPDR